MDQTGINISEAEWTIMQTLWTHERPMTLGEITSALDGKTSWSQRTIQTLVRRLTEKGAVGYHEARYFRYYPLVSEKECLKEELHHFMSRLFKDSPGKLMAALVESGELSSDDIEEISAMLESLRAKGSDRP